MPKIGGMRSLSLCYFWDVEIMSKFFAIALALTVALSGVVHAQTSGSDNQVIENASALLTRHQQRMDILEAGLMEPILTPILLDDKGVGKISIHLDNTELWM